MFLRTFFETGLIIELLMSPAKKTNKNLKPVKENPEIHLF